MNSTGQGLHCQEPCTGKRPTAALIDEAEVKRIAVRRKGIGDTVFDRQSHVHRSIGP